jgi:ketosteroid isomerase-like protein
LNRISTIEWVYAAISRGDVDAIWSCVADDMVWEQATESKSFPWVTVARGRDAVVRGLHSVPGITIRVEPQSFNETSAVLAVTVRFEVTMPARRETEGEWTSTWIEVHHWQFDAAGMICQLRQRGEAIGRRVEAGGGRLFPFGGSRGDDGGCGGNGFTTGETG